MNFLVLVSQNPLVLTADGPAQREGWTHSRGQDLLKPDLQEVSHQPWVGSVGASCALPRTLCSGPWLYVEVSSFWGAFLGLPGKGLPSLPLCCPLHSCGSVAANKYLFIEEDLLSDFRCATCTFQTACFAVPESSFHTEICHTVSRCQGASCLRDAVQDPSQGKSSQEAVSEVGGSWGGM